jgi:alkanesulfonate monooxygenase SsuD/methylene tetrahydromethanopterin reductase-like flavin-dependent oxidoreductase (luciferase family)
MRIGIGIPNTTLGVQGSTITAWAKLAEPRGFSALATIGRLAWPGYDELIALAAAAGVTDRIGLLTNILLVPLYDTPLLAKQTASLDQISEGRLTLGMGVGTRADDFEVAGKDLSTRGRRMDEQLAELHEAWAGRPIAGASQPVAPRAVRGRIPLLFGGKPELAAERAARWGAGFTIGGAPPEMAEEQVEAFRAAYANVGGAGSPQIVCLSYFSVGEEHTEESLHNLRSYYARLGDVAEAIAHGAARNEEAILNRVGAYEALGADLLVLTPTVNDVDQVERLADIAIARA